MGWQSCSFLVTPQQLEKALEPFVLVVDNACQIYIVSKVRA